MKEAMKSILSEPNEPKTATKSQSKANTQEATNKAKTLHLGRFAQITRQFNILKDSVETCKRVFPDCFHFKVQTAKECKQLAEGLAQGEALLQSLAKIRPLTTEEKAQAKAFRNTSRYLIKQLESVAEYVEQVKATEEETNATT